MTFSPPIRPVRQGLPFHGDGFTWEDFEEFFCSFLAAQPLIEVQKADGHFETIQIKSARPFGRRGDQQNGIDLRAETETGEVWAFECKHHSKWTKAKTEAAIKKCKYKEAQRKFLLVTSEVNEKCRKVVEGYPGWTIWDGRDISREFLRLKPETAAAIILFRCFGPGWSEQFFNISGVGPLMTADAFFKPWLDEKRDFNHKLPLVGSNHFREVLDSFVKDGRHRIMLISGRGGIGKSRHLYEWSKEFSRGHPGVTLYFASRLTENFSPYLGSQESRIVVVLDDAHQEMSLRTKLFDAAVRNESVQLVLSLRPGLTEAIREELFSAGYDTGEMGEMEALKPLKDEDALALAKEALGNSHASYVDVLYNASKDCPLIAVVGGALIRKGKVRGNLYSDQAIRSAVFEHLGKQVKEVVKQGFDLEEIENFLGIVSLLSPVANTPEFRTKVAEFFGGECTAPHVASLIDALETAQVMLAGISGLRVIPDLYSDDVAYRVCYDKHGNDKQFANRILHCFGESVIPSITRHLAETEWRAQQEHEKPQSVIAPIIEWFHAKYISGTFLARAELLNKWNEIAVFRPIETLDFVRLAIKEDQAPPDPAVAQLKSEWVTEQDSYADVLTHVPALLRSVGAHHARYVKDSMELLWQLTATHDSRKNQGQNHPLAVMADIYKFERWKSVAVCLTALDWLEAFFQSDQWLDKKIPPAEILTVLLKPFLESWMDATFWTRRQAILRILPVDPSITREMRSRVMVICRKVLERKNPIIDLAVLQLAEDGAGEINPPFGGNVTPELEAKWLPERRASLALFGEVMRATEHLGVYLTAHKSLLLFMRRGGAPEFIADCEQLLSMIPDTLPMRLMRVLFSNSHDEFGEKYDQPDRDIKVVLQREKEAWQKFLGNVATEIATAYPEPTALAQFIERIAAAGKDMGWPGAGIRPFMLELLNRFPGLGRSMVDYILGNSVDILANVFDLLVHQTTLGDMERRFDCYRRAIQSERELLISSAIYGLSAWRAEGSLPDEAWDLVIAAANEASTHVAWAIVRFVETNGKKLDPRDLKVLELLPLAESHSGLITDVLEALENPLRSNSKPVAIQSLEKIFKQLVSLPEVPGGQFRYALSNLADDAPNEIFSFLHERVMAKEAKQFGKNYQALPYWISEIRFSKLDSLRWIKDLSRRLLEEDIPYELNTLLRIAIAASEVPEEVLSDLVDQSDSTEKFEHMLNIMFLSFHPMAPEYPLWAKKCLQRARQFGSDVYEETRRRFLLNCDKGGGFTNGEPDEGTRMHWEGLKNLSQKYAGDAELGPLFNAAAERMAWMIESNRKEYLSEITES